MNNEAFYQTLLDNLNDGVYFIDEDRRITSWNKGAERITGYTASEIIGRNCENNLLVHADDDGNSLNTGICQVEGPGSEVGKKDGEVYILHKDGHLVPISMRAVAIRDRQGRFAGGLEIFTDRSPASIALDRLAELERLAFIDPLTGLANRRYAEITLHARTEELQRYDWKFGVLFIDIDRFKDVNDRYGHAIGDEVLKMTARTLQNSVRTFDLVSRWGGEEFVAVIANVEGDELVATANRCRTLVEQSSLPVAEPVRVTISLGGTLARRDDTVEAVIKRADQLMYRSKETGRNRVTTDLQLPVG